MLIYKTNKKIAKKIKQIEGQKIKGQKHMEHMESKLCFNASIILYLEYADFTN